MPKSLLPTSRSRSLALSHPVLFQTPAGKVAGRVLVNETSLLFVEVRAKITPEEFVGIRSVNRAASAAVDAASQGQRGCHAVSWPRSISASVLQSSASTGAEASPSPTDSPSKQGLAGEGQQPYLPKLGSRVRMYLRQTWTSGTELDGSKCQGPGDWEDEYGPTDEVGLWEVLWKDGGGNGPLRRLKFEASARTRQMVHQHVENWAVDTTPESSAGSGGASRAPTVLVVRDTRGYIFGCYTSDAWRVAPRYYGTGECFVYTLAPQMRAWHWERRGPASNNNFFMYGAHDSLAIGGGGHFALWLDNELMYGASGPCQTFASPCLSSSQDFAISKLELWSII
ncbi:hypothetical protein WJX72_011701 [[Myrmecia] bisecta]|uniref:Oxidation resistance protein 1 n=1 Tax=[Myrmecia] bisecta TaxID=41462 RepID=A0AAW1PMC8_9CHLO